MPDSDTLASEIVTLPSLSFPTCVSSNAAASSKCCGAPRASPIWSTISTPLMAACPASSSLALLSGSGALPDSVTRVTSRSADHTKGFASGTRRVSSLTSRTPGTASTVASAFLRPSCANTSAASVTSRPSTVICVLSSTTSLSAALLLAARSASSGTVLVQAAMAQKATRRITPGHHLRLQLNKPYISLTRAAHQQGHQQLSDSRSAFDFDIPPARLWRTQELQISSGLETQRENKPLPGCQTGNNTGT